MTRQPVKKLKMVNSNEKHSDIKNIKKLAITTDPTDIRREQENIVNG